MVKQRKVSELMLKLSRTGEKEKSEYIFLSLVSLAV
jgi:hypothetical protein